MNLPFKGLILFSICFVIVTSMDTLRTKNQEKINAINKHTKRQVPLSYDFGFMDYAAYDYYDWVCDATLDTCQLCDVLTGSCCDPKANDNCFLPDSCANNPCLSGGTCVTTRTRDNYPDFVCVCNRGLTGKYCQLVDDFTPPLVVPVPTIVPAPGRVNPVVAPPLNRPQTPQNGYGGMNAPMAGATGGMNTFGGQQQQQQQTGSGGFFGNRGGAPDFGSMGGMSGVQGMGNMGMNSMGMGAMGMGQGAMNPAMMGAMAGRGAMGGMGGLGAMGGMGGLGGMGGMGGLGGMGMGGLGGMGMGGRGAMGGLGGMLG